MTGQPTAAPARFPYPEHRTMAKVIADDLPRDINCQTCGDTVTPGEDFSCAYHLCPIGKEPLW